ncbi:MAG: helix-turn-helix domain-containing protein [Planctomycetota bacterium]
MAGKFLSLDEAARRLGVSVDEINRLVDRKELFPMRDGATIKFKVDEIERVAADLGVGAADESDDLSLDLDLSSPGLGGSLSAAGSGGDDLTLGDAIDEESIFAGEGSLDAATGSQTAVGGNAPAAASGVFDVDDLAIESIVSASSPSLAMGSSPGDGEGSGTLAIDLGGAGSGSLAGVLPGLSDASGAGGSLAAAVDSGLSLEGGDLEVSGIDLDRSVAGGSLVGSGVADASGGSLAGDQFELGVDTSDEESASVVIATEETGDSSFFSDAIDDSASASFDGASGVAGVPMADMADMDLVPAAAPFSVWQVVGLVCCTLLMFLGGLVVFDVLATVRSPQGSPVSSPLLSALAETFGW